MKWNYEVHILGNSSFYDFNNKVVFNDMTLKEEWIPILNTYWKSVLEQIALIEPDVVIVCDNGLKVFTVPF
jgi:hypothetical protein